ncbi:hypothetical protein VTN00DRAFT_6135 [Thermoascus crustaceus]|uniref:uncharacterized protein n=1 Tax=Thermoascus crustaceus TaxID=5088 RepID=UPI003742D25E
MNGFAARTNIDPLANGWDWSSIAAVKGTVVDVSDGWGPVSISLAQRFPDIKKFIVQDLGNVIDLKDRVMFRLSWLSMDLNMMTFFGSRERTLVERTTIIKEADPRLKIRVHELGPVRHVLDVTLG